MNSTYVFFELYTSNATYTTTSEQNKSGKVGTALLYNKLRRGFLLNLNSMIPNG